MEVARETKAVVAKPLTKTELAKKLGVSRSSLYYEPKRPALDLELKFQIETVMAAHKSYGHKRIAPELKMNKKRVLRVMKKFGLKPYRRRTFKPTKKDDLGKPPARYGNLIKLFCPIRPNVVWVSDFTYIKYKGRFIYLATIMDLFTREIVGWNVARSHNKELVIGALLDAMKRTGTVPIYLHSDQGSEYESGEYITLAESNNIDISMSKKGNPWENGFQESFYSEFKVDLGRTDRFELFGELIEAIHLQIHEYNTDRIHTSLKMTPAQFRDQYYNKLKDGINKKVFTTLSKELGT